MGVTLYGSSDDLIEVEGDIEEEFYPFTDSPACGGETGAVLGFSDGTVLRIVYSRAGVWRITPVVEQPGRLSIERAPEDDEDNYTDRATITGTIKWVVKGNDYAPKRRR